jgi:MULE transposase domain
MAYSSDLFTSSPTTSSPEALFFTPLSNRARSTTPEHSPVSPTPGRSPLREVPLSNGLPSADLTELDFTGLGGDEGNDSETRFAASVLFQTSQGTSQQFVSRFKAYDYVQAWAGTEGFSIKMGRTRKRSDKKTIYHQTFSCVCGGTKDNSKLPSPQRKRKGSRSKHTGCKWHCIVVEEGGTWRGYMSDQSLHNHPRSFGATYPVRRRLARQAEPGIHERIMSDAKVPTISAKETHIAIRHQFPDVPINITDIFNTKGKMQAENDQGLSTVQAMARDIGDAFYFHYSVDEANRLLNLIFIEKASLNLLRRWPYTIILDATYKTNKFGMYLVDIVGMTGSGKRFIIAQSFLSAEGEDDYSFVLDWLKDVYITAGLDLPLSITSDAAGGLRVALRKIFPDTAHLLCTVHINRDVLTWCKRYWQEELLANVGGNPLLFDSDDDLSINPITVNSSRETSLISAEEREQYLETREKRFLTKWNAVMSATTLTGEAGFEKAWTALRLQYLGDGPEIITYLEKTWLPYKKSFCKAWTNLIRHFSNTTSNRAEGSHRGVKKKLPQHRLHIRKVIDIMKAYLEVANEDHLKDVETERTSIGNYFIRPVLYEVRHRISTFAIRKMEEHLRFFKSDHLSELPRCKKSFYRIWGVPCAHMVYEKIEAVECLKVSDFHPQWHLKREKDYPPIDPALLLRDPLIVRDSKSKGKASKTGRMLSAFEHVDQSSTIITTPRRQTTASSDQRKSPSSSRKQVPPIPYWKYTRNSKGPPAPTPEDAIHLACARSGRKREEFINFAAASYLLDLEGRCRYGDDPVALHDEHGWTHITACGNARVDPFDDEVYPEYEEEIYTFFSDVLMTQKEKECQAEMLRQWSECQANPRYVYTWMKPRAQPQQDTVIDSIEKEIEQALPTPQVLKSALKRRREDTEQEKVESEVLDTQGAYRGTRSRSRSVAPRKRVRFSETV